MRSLPILLLLVPMLAIASNWECANSQGWDDCNLYRYSVPHGWIIKGHFNTGVGFYPDENHEWKI